MTKGHAKKRAITVNYPANIVLWGAITGLEQGRGQRTPPKIHQSTSQTQEITFSEHTQPLASQVPTLKFS